MVVVTGHISFLSPFPIFTLYSTLGVEGQYLGYYIEIYKVYLGLNLFT